MHGLCGPGRLCWAADIEASAVQSQVDLAAGQTVLPCLYCVQSVLCVASSEQHILHVRVGATNLGPPARHQQTERKAERQDNKRRPAQCFAVNSESRRFDKPVV